jgi:hypothetical protein
LAELEQQHEAPRELIVQLMKFLRKEIALFDGLRAWYIEENTDEAPAVAANDHRLSQRFYNQLYWKWFQQRRAKEGVAQVRETWATERSGVWYAFNHDDHLSDESVFFPALELELPGGFKSWLHAELYNRQSVHGDSQKPIGKLQLRVADDSPEVRMALWDALKQRKDGLERLGIEIPRRRPSKNSRSWNVLTRPLLQSDFRYSRLSNLSEDLCAAPLESDA